MMWDIFSSRIQIQHLLKLNLWIKNLSILLIKIQIQHLLKLNVANLYAKDSVMNSNTTLVKVKYRCGIDAGYNTEFKYNTC